MFISPLSHIVGSSHPLLLLLLASHPPPLPPRTLTDCANDLDLPHLIITIRRLALRWQQAGVSFRLIHPLSSAKAGELGITRPPRSSTTRLAASSLRERYTYISLPSTLQQVTRFALRSYGDTREPTLDFTTICGVFAALLRVSIS